MATIIDTNLLRSYIANNEVNHVVYNGAGLDCLVVDGETVWQSRVILEVTKMTNQLTYDSGISYSGEDFILLDIYPKRGGTVTVTYGGLTKTITDDGTSEIPPAQQVFFGTFLGVTDVVQTPMSGTLTIMGARAVGTGCFLYPTTDIEGNSSIGELRFTGVTKITSLGRVEEIPDRAFMHCKDFAFTSVVIPDSVTSIGDWAFGSCYQLRSIHIPNSVTSIGSYAFDNCLSLYDIAIPDSVTEIGEWAFNYCGDLTSITIPGSVTSLGSSVFRDCNELAVVVISDGVTTISSNMFYNCEALVKITIPDSVTIIEGGAFRKCHSLKYVEIPNSVTTIGVYAFCDCDSIERIVIPESVRRIDNYAFYGCTALQRIEIPASVTRIAPDTFNACTSLTGVIIPDSVTSIGDSAFWGCLSLTDIYHKGNEGDWEQVEIGLNNDYLMNATCYYYSETYPSTAGNFWYYNTAGIPVIWNTAKPSIAIGVKPISAYTYASGTTYFDESFILLDIYPECGGTVYVNYGGLTKIITDDGMNETPLAQQVFFGTFNGVSDNLEMPLSGIVEITGDYRGFGAGGFMASAEDAERGNVTYYSGIESAGNLGKVEMIPDYAFYASAIEDIHMPDSITSIGDHAFAKCHRLRTIHIPDSVTSIGDDAFLSCDALTSVAIPDSVTSMGQWAFSTCSNLTSVVIGNNIINLGIGVFAHCPKLTSIVIPDGVTGIDGYAFQYCTGLTSIIIPNSVASINDYAFYGCSSLKDIYYVGSEDDWANIAIRPNNIEFNNATRYYYSESQPTTAGNYWYYVDGVPTAWVTKSSEGLEYALNKDETEYAVSGIGTCDDSTIIVPNIYNNLPVTSIGAGAFGSCSNLIGITVMGDGASLVAIGANAFEACQNLTTVNLPYCASIGAFAFASCPSLVAVDFPSGRYIGANAFASCASLTTFTAGSRASASGQICSQAFERCSNLTNVTLYHPSMVTLSNVNAFAECPTDICVYVPASIWSDYLFNPVWNTTGVVMPIEA